jgi:hypothetical protein
VGHFVSLFLFSLLVSVVFALLTKETQKERSIYFLKMFAAFVGLSILAAWFMYLFPFK